VTPRPPIFISAVSRELRSARQLVANTLTFLGYQPIWQDIFGTEGGDLRGLLRQQIDQCKGVVQLVGQSYGAEPPTPDEEFGRVSYTQYEALYARKRGKKIWYLFIDETFPIDPHDAEPDELRELQAAYRHRLQSDTHIFHPLTSHEALEAGVLKLRDDLTRLRRGVKRWTLGVTGLLVFIAAMSLWLMQAQRRQSKALHKQGEQVSTIVDRYQKMQEALVRLAEVEAQTKEPGAKLSPEEQRARAYAVLEKDLGLPADTLAKELPGFALELYSRSDTSPLMRARAAYALNKFDEAEKLSLDGAAQDRQAYENTQRVGEERRKSAIESYVLAGQSAQKRIQYNDALAHFREAEKLTDRDRNPKEWAEVQQAIGDLSLDQGKYGEAENTLHAVVDVRAHTLGPEHRDTLRSRNSLANARWKQGNYAEAENDFRNAISAEERVLGPEHPETLRSRQGLATILYEKGRYAEAEAEHRVILTLMEKVLGQEHSDTLNSKNRLGLSIVQQGKYAEAEALFRDLIRTKQKILGPDHPDTLKSCNNLAMVLGGAGRHADAEAQYREVVKSQERVIGPEHPDTLRVRTNLSNELAQQGKYAEAETEYREITRIRGRVLRADHPDTLLSRSDLAWVFNFEHKYAEAEAEIRPVIKLQEKTIGADNPDTLFSCATLTEALLGQGKYAQAEAECCNLVGLQTRVIGPEHPETLESRSKLARALLALGKDAEAEMRDVIKLREKVLGPEHPDLLQSCYDFAAGLKGQGKIQEAKKCALRAAEGARKTLGREHPDTMKYEKLLQELEAQR
jgi:tetratricopeptide (TPR) repeat protein